MDKGPLIAAWRDELQSRLATLQASQESARSGTRVDGEHRPSNRGERAAVTSQGYLAHAFGARSLDLQTHLDQLDDMGAAPRDEVVIGAVIRIRIDEQPSQTIALLPGGDATTLTIDGRPIKILSANSPLARQLRDAEDGDVLEVDLGGTVRDLTVELIS